MIVKIIAALSLDGIIGENQGLIWHIPEDLENYKRETTNKYLIVGRKTYESLPKVALKNRNFLVLSKDKEIEKFNALRQWADDYVSSKEEIFKILKEKNINEVIVIGGEQIYNLFINDATEVLITWINKIISNDKLADYKYFPTTELFENFTLVDDSNWVSSKKEGLPKYKFSRYIKNYQWD